MEEIEEVEIQKKKDKLNEKEQDKFIFIIDCDTTQYNELYIKNELDDLRQYMIDSTLDEYYDLSYVYSDERKDHLLWIMIRNLCNINTLRKYIDLLYKETILFKYKNEIVKSIKSY
jgi:hypothetical protein